MASEQEHMTLNAGDQVPSALWNAINGRQVQLRNKADGLDSFTFVVLADPQFGIIDSYVEKKPPPHTWDTEKQFFKVAIGLINRMSPRPEFVMICGDLVDGCPGHAQREHMIRDLKACLAKLDPSIDLLVLPGNHDLRGRPSLEDIATYKTDWGEDFYEFSLGCVDFLVLNSQPWYDMSNCQEHARLQQDWLESRQDAGRPKIVFQHIPLFRQQPTEPDDYFNLPGRSRDQLLRIMWQKNVQAVFSGHLHYNLEQVWRPADGQDTQPSIQMITTSSVCMPLGKDLPGFRVCHVNNNAENNNNDFLSHRYFTFAEAEREFSQ